jgi:CheY-like chemotaxis protein
VVLGDSSLALHELEGQPGVRRHLERIRSAGRYAAQLVDQMLTYAGRATPKVTALDLSRLVDEMLDLLHPSAAGKSGLTTDLAEGLPSILGDETQIRQVVMNLVGNACEASEEGARPVRVRTGVMRPEASWLDDAVLAPRRPEGEYVYLEVADRGPGMDAATRARIFDPFYTTRSSGRGLGLAVVLGIVRAHDGAIHLESEPGRGTTLHILFPQATELMERAAAPAGAPPAPERDTAVLVVDDDEALLELAARFLERGGFRVYTASGGRRAAEIFETHGNEIEAVVLDVSMPNVGGRETLQLLKRRRPGVRVLLTSGFGETAVAARFSGAVRPAAFLRKPYEPEELVARVRQMLAGEGE